MTIAGVGAVARASANAEDPRRTKLVEASQQFEAMMLSTMLKPMQFGAAPGDGASDGESSGGMAETVRGMATEALGKALAQHGGVGIARSVLRQVLDQAQQREAVAVGLKAEHPHAAPLESVLQKKTGAKVL